MSRHRYNFEQLYPHLALELDLDRNSSPEVFLGQDLLHWRCKLGHPYPAKITNRISGKGCPFCAGQEVLVGFNDLATTDPHLACELDEIKSGVTASEITRGSDLVRWWLCSRGHSYPKAVNKRTSNDSGCTVCSGHRILSGFNDLATTHPEIAEQMAPDSVIRAEELSYGSNQMVVWKCELDHSWSASVKSRTLYGTECSYCSYRELLPGFNDLATIDPHLANSLDEQASGVMASQLLASDKRTLHWRCSLGHKYLSKIKLANNCDDCKSLSQYAKSLAFLHPEIAAQLDEAKSGITAAELPGRSGKKVWWKCSKGHSYTMTVANKVGRNSRCTKCSMNGRSKMEMDLEEAVRSIYGGKVVANDRITIGPKELDLYFPELNKAIEFNGTRYHDRSAWEADLENGTVVSRERVKDKLTFQLGLALEHIWEEDWKNDKERVLRGMRYFLCAELGWAEI